MHPLLLLIDWITKKIVWLGCAAFILLLISPVILWGMGYRFNAASDEVAAIAAKEKDVTMCNKIINIWLFGPSSGAARMHCIKRYAEYAKDPSACELLMPSSYGWSCLGAAEVPNTRQCWFDFGPNPPQVGRGNEFVTIPECASNPKSMRENRCCELAQTLYVEKKTSCDHLKTPRALHDQCQELMARRDKNISYCTGIVHENIRSSCEVAVRSLQKK